jgi:hypothetical protein
MMKKDVLRNVVFAINFLIPLAANAQWVQINPPAGSRVVSLAGSGGNIFAGTQNGAFLSSNNGTSWSPAGLSNDTVSALSVGGGNIFAVITHRSGYIYTCNLSVSTDNGTSWNGLHLGVSDNLSAIIVSGSNLFAGSVSHGVLNSANNGSNWQYGVGISIPVYSLAVNDSTLCAGTENGVYLSTNNATSWTPAGLQNASIYIYALALSGGNIFASTNSSNVLAKPYNSGGVFLSSNNGASWTTAGLSNDTIIALGVNDSNLFAAERIGGVWRRPLSEFATGVIAHKPAQTLPENRFRIIMPNHSGSYATVIFSLQHSERVSLRIYDISGCEMNSLVDQNLESGYHCLKWDVRNLAAGSYTIRAKAGADSYTKNISILK